MLSGLVPALSLAPSPAAGAEVRAPTPPMGWNPWYRFGCNVDEALVRQIADAMVASGLSGVGYRYVNLDDCWMAQQRSASGALAADPQKFPGGLAQLASYVHARGLRLGVYLDAGSATCGGYPGSGGHYEQDAATLASWGVDYVKVDFCNTGAAAMQDVYGQMRRAIDRAGRPMLLSISEWGLGSPWSWAPGLGDLWRTTGDYSWYGAPRNYWWAVNTVANINASLARYAHPGAWNDPDVLLAGTGFLTVAQERSQISLWSMMAAPLLADGDLRSMSRATRAILGDREVTAVDQDPAGIQGVRVATRGYRQEWLRQMSDGSRVLLLFNAGPSAAWMQADARHLGLPGRGRFAVRDLWRLRSFRTRGAVRALVPSDGVAMYRVWRGGS